MGDRRLDAALQKFAHKDQVEIVYRSFELDPHRPRDPKHDVYEYLAQKYGMSREQAISAYEDMARQAASVGLHYRFDTMIPTNTLDAHRLVLLAAKVGKGGQMVERLFYAYFTESKHIGDPQTLVQLAVEVGLDAEEVSKMLKGEEYTKEVREDEQEAANLGVRGVPFFVINRKYGLSGAQASEIFLEALEKAWQEESPITLINSEGVVCDDTGCEIPKDGHKKKE